MSESNRQVHTPCGNANTVLKVEASLDDSLPVGSRGAGDVKLSDGDLETKLGEGFHVCDLVFKRRAGSDNQMVLQPNAVDLDAVGLCELDDVEGCA